MRQLLAGATSILAAALTCLACMLPSCASMGGGGMKGMLSEPAAMARESTG
ncbi:MAG TPA: hypothetical protein VMN79_14480 [Casimicrobiaceae bacterium]|nr:hypothetical protein [Casimicrobiaceae bacterium]